MKALTLCTCVPGGPAFYYSGDALLLGIGALNEGVRHP